MGNFNGRNERERDAKKDPSQIRTGEVVVYGRLLFETFEDINEIFE